MQRGCIFQRHGSWHLRYRANGKQMSRKLADANDQYRTLKSVRPLAEEILHSINQRSDTGPLTLQQFIETVYLPHAKIHRRPSTFRGYQNLYNAHVRAHVGGLRMFSFRTVDGQRLMNAISEAHDLAHLTLVHIKSFLSGVFTVARRLDAYENFNPMQAVEIPAGKESEETYAYSNDEINKMIQALEGTARAAVIVAAYTGLSLGELQGLKWEDIADDQLNVRRTIWHGIEGKPKTKARKDSIPVLPIVAEALAAHRAANPGTKWVFEGPYVKAYDLAGLGNKRIKVALEGSGVKWRGWHPARRGFATRLHEAGVADRTIQALMRHSSLSVTMKHYVKSTPAVNIEAMRKLNPENQRLA